MIGFFLLISLNGDVGGLKEFKISQHLKKKCFTSYKLSETFGNIILHYQKYLELY